MNFEEFLQPKDANDESERDAQIVPDEDSEVQPEVDNIGAIEEIDVQKAVVESLAADKAVQDERIDQLLSENAKLREEKKTLEKEVENLKAKIAEQVEALNKVGDVLSANALTDTSNQVSLIDRNTEVPDRFPGETRDHVIEAIREARDKAEQEGRERRAQLLESVLVENEPSGNLAKKKAALEKFFKDNQNVISGPVIEELQKYGISHKKGDQYLLPSEIINRTY